MQIFEGKNKNNKHFLDSCLVKSHLTDPVLINPCKSLFAWRVEGAEPTQLRLRHMV